MSDYDEDDKKEPNRDEDETLLEQARECFRLACDTEAQQREREQEDLKFQVPEMQWTDRERAARGQRPCLAISKIDQPLQLILNQMRSANLGVQIHPVSEEASDDTAEMLQGLYRHIERTSNAELARFWAFDRAVKAGRGVYRVLTEYDEEGGHPADQKIVIRRVYQQGGVYFDPAAQEPDFCDGEWAFVVSWMKRKAFKRMFPNAKAGSADRLDWEGLGNDTPEWVRDDDVLVAEYIYKTHKTETVTVKIDGETIKHQRDKVTVWRKKITGLDVLDTQRWMGQYIPLIPVTGRELQPFDEQRRSVGMIRNARDGQHLYNYAASTLVERMALEPKTPFVGAAGQFEGHTDKWKNVNNATYPFIEYNPVSIAGVAAPPPQRAQIDASGMSLAMMALQQADKDIQATTSVYDPSLGRESSRDKSGKAIMALQQQADAGTGHYLQNLADISMVYEAKVILDLIPKIYDRPGRVTRILRGDDGKTETVMLNRPYVMDPQTKRPMPPPPDSEKPKHYDLKRGVYSVSVSIGKSFQTRLEEGSSMIGEFLAAKPELFMMLGDIFLRFQTWPGAKDMEKRLVKIQEQQGMKFDEEGQMPTPEQAKAQIAQMGQQLQMMQQQMQAAVQQIQTDQAKQQAAMAKAQMEAQTAQMEITAKVQMSESENASRERIAQMNNETKLAIEGLANQMNTLLAATQNAQDVRARHEEMAHEAALAAAGGNTTTTTMERGEDQGREVGEDMSHDSSSMPMAPEGPVE